MGDYAVVLAPNFDTNEVDAELVVPKVVKVVSVDADVTFDPQDQKAYGWLVQLLDFTHYEGILKQVQHAADQLKIAQRQRMRAVFKQQFLDTLSCNNTDKDTL